METTLRLRTRACLLLWVLNLPLGTALLWQYRLLTVSVLINPKHIYFLQEQGNTSLYALHTTERQGDLFFCPLICITMYILRDLHALNIILFMHYNIGIVYSFLNFTTSFKGICLFVVWFMRWKFSFAWMHAHWLTNTLDTLLVTKFVPPSVTLDMQIIVMYKINTTQTSGGQ